MRPILRPGCHVLRRRDGEIQVGLHPEGAVLLPDTPEVRATLGLVTTAAYHGDGQGDRVLSLLERSDLLLDAPTLTRLIGSETLDPSLPSRAKARGRPAPPRPLTAAVARAEGNDVPHAVARRTTAVVEVVAFGGTEGERLGALMRGILDEAAITTCSAGDHGSSRTRNDSTWRTRHVGALVGVGEPPREVVDLWVRETLPHVVVRLSEGCATIGPFVVPARTACLRCLDAHCTDADPSWPLLVRQYASASSGDRADGVPEPVDPLLARVALAWAARDLATHVEGRTPSTWSCTVRLDAHLTAIQSERWAVHRECGCSWG